METILIVKRDVHITYIEEFVQGLIGNQVPHYEDYIAEKIIQFQIYHNNGDYDDYVAIYLLIEVSLVRDNEPPF